VEVLQPLVARERQDLKANERYHKLAKKAKKTGLYKGYKGA